MLGVVPALRFSCTMERLRMFWGLAGVPTALADRTGGLWETHSQTLQPELRCWCEGNKTEPSRWGERLEQSHICSPIHIQFCPPR